MPSTFFGLEIGRRALSANQLALNVTGQNTANVSTPGYSRQVVTLSATDPYTTPTVSQPQSGQLGTGVTVASVARVRDEFVDRRLYDANAQQGALNNLQDVLGQVENAYGEPGTSGIGQQLTDFFNSFSDLSASPESGAVRSTVRNRAESLVSAFHAVSTALGQITPEIQGKITAKIGAINTIANQIADLNKQIRLGVAAGDHPNDLLDKRGALLDSLSGLVDIQVIDSSSAQSGQKTGEIQINVGGYTLVQGDSSYVLPAETTTKNGVLGLVDSAGNTIPLRGGEIYGLIKAGTLLSGYQADLDTLASSAITAVNTQHAAGYGLDGINGRAFFTGTSAASISVSSVIQGDLNTIAAGGIAASGNGDNARALAALTSRPVIGSYSLNAYYNSQVSSIGADSQTFQTQSGNQQSVVQQLKNLQSSVSGVSLDEELTKLLQYQRSYQAAARLVNVQDSILNTIINGLGTGQTVA